METVLLDENPVTSRLPMTKEQFLNWSPDTGLLFEFENGFAEPTTGMKKEERYLVINIQDRFSQTNAYKLGSRLLPETDCWLTANQMRRPDVALFTKAQIRLSVQGDQEPIPAFVIEIISPTDVTDHVEKKVLEYFRAGVEVIWHIHPALNMVRVISSPKVANTFFDNDLFSAAPILPDLQLTVAELFTVG